MPLKLHPDRLNKEELEYEIKIRGAVPSGTVKELISTLKQLIKLQEEGHSFKLCLESNPKEELEVCITKISEIKQCLSEEFTSTLSRKLESKLAHTLGRIENISSKEKTDIEERSKILSKALKCLTEFEGKQESFGKSKQTNNPVDIEFQTKISNASTSTPVKKSFVSEEDTSELSHQLNSTTITNKTNISKWGLKFSGESDALGLNAFLERVNELSESRSVTTQQLFKSAVELFEGKALVYYRSLRDKITDWGTLCEYFRDEFLPRDFNDKIWEQIKFRTQGDKESIAIYIAYMNNLFSRLTIHVEESVELKIIKKNILPFYQNQLLLVEITSLEHLIRLCRKIEDNRRDILNFVPPSSSKNIVETDLSYKDEKYSKKKLDNVEFKKVSFDDDFDSFSKNSHDSTSENESYTDHRQKLPKSDHNPRSKERRVQYRDSSRDSSVGSRDRSFNRNKHRSGNNNVKSNGKNSKYRVNSVEGNKESLDVNREKNRDVSADRFRDFSGNQDRNSERDRDFNRDFSKDRYRDYKGSREYGWHLQEMVDNIVDKC